MLYLILQLGKERLALATRQVIEVVPFVNLKPLAQTPNYVSGIFNFRGTMVPVVDLCSITTGKPSRAWLTTRIVIVDYLTKEDNPRLLGLLVEQVNDTRKLKDDAFNTSGIDLPETPYLGDFAKLNDGLVQRIEVNDLLPSEVRALLFKGCA